MTPQPKIYKAQATGWMGSIMEIFHIATLADWSKATKTGRYSTSTLGRTLKQEGFIHASRRGQVQGVLRSYYGAVSEPLIILKINPELLGCEVKEEVVGKETYPHIYGPIPVAAVTQVTALKAGNRVPGVLELWLGDAFKRMGWAVFAMFMALGGARLGAARIPEWGAAIGAIGGLALGALLAWLVVRRKH